MRTALVEFFAGAFGKSPSRWAKWEQTLDHSPVSATRIEII